MKLVSFVWRTAVSIVAIVVAAFAASEIGWDGANLALYEPLMNWSEIGTNLILLVLCLTAAVGSVFLVEYCQPKANYILIPIMAISALINIWNGYWSDFDYTRLQALKNRDQPANAYALKTMTRRGLYLTCNDRRIQLTQDADEYCAERLSVLPGDQVPGSEHYCGNFFIDAFFRQTPTVCIETVPKPQQ